MNHVRPLTDGFINQRVFNIENEKKNQQGFAR